MLVTQWKTEDWFWFLFSQHRRTLICCSHGHVGMLTVCLLSGWLVTGLPVTCLLACCLTGLPALFLILKSNFTPPRNTGRLSGRSVGGTGTAAAAGWRWRGGVGERSEGAHVLPRAVQMIRPQAMTRGAQLQPRATRSTSGTVSIGIVVGGAWMVMLIRAAEVDGGRQADPVQRQHLTAPMHTRHRSRLHRHGSHSQSRDSVS